ncbi:MAG: hypothetical protein RI885_397 [Actinomycetota bacterium]|jgi:dolichol-phosphate mannosyltransferase
MIVADTLIVLPTFDELDNLEGMLGRLRQAVPEADVLIVDDSSPDGTGELADRLAHDDAGVTVLHRPRRQGLGRAYLEGFELARESGYVFAVEIDADGSHDPADLPAMLELARRGADLVIGSRWVPGGSVRNWPWIRLAISRVGNLYSRLMLGSEVSDLTSGFRVLNLATLGEIAATPIASQGYCFQVELAWTFERRGATVVEHPIVFSERRLGRSKMHIGIVVEALWRVTVWGIGRTVPRGDRESGSGRRAQRNPRR